MILVATAPDLLGCQHLQLLLGEDNEATADQMAHAGVAQDGLSWLQAIVQAVPQKLQSSLQLQLGGSSLPET